MADAPVQIHSALRQIWVKNLPQTRERMALLTRAAEHLREGRLPAELRTEAHSTAHKLAGSLGMFGYGSASQHARALEHLLQGEATAAPAEMEQHLQALQAALQGALD